MPRINLRWLVMPCAAAGVLVAAFYGVRAAVSLPVTRLDIEGTFQRVTPLQVEAAVAPVLDQGFLTLDLHSIRQRIQALDWVDSVELTRIWPDTLSIRIVEQQAAARWGEAALLNVRGELFGNERRYSLPELPLLSGPSGSERELAERYLDIRDRLATAGLGLQALTMDQRGAWSVELDGGQLIRLGTQDVDARLRRLFAVALPALSSSLNRVSYVDMRYTNGFAVAWVGELELTRANASDVLGSG
jgi:cell division protein FtsQ